jgi:hypothetical protein
MSYEEKVLCYVRVYKNGRFLTALSLEKDAEDVVTEILSFNKV